MSTNVKVPTSSPAPSAPVAATNSSNAAEKSSGFIKGTWKKTKEGFLALMSDKGPLMIFIIAVILVFVIVIIYISFALKNANLKGKVLIKNPVKLDALSTAIQISNSDIPKPAVGREFTYSFWLYVDEFTQTTDNHKLLFYRGAKNTISSANTLVMMDGQENRLYFMIQTEGSSLTAPVTGDLRPAVTGNLFKNLTSSTISNNNKYIIMEVDYVPVQRWVNIICVVDNKIITLFMDGEIYSVKTTDELKAIRKPTLDDAGNPTPYNLIINKQADDIYVGKNTINNGNTLNGYISKLEFMNYAISLNQVKTSYNRGPLSGSTGNFLPSMGINYGVRSPLYKLNENIQA
jgi:hypothetical protein